MKKFLQIGIACLFVLCFPAAALFGTPTRGFLVLAGIVGLTLMSFVLLYEAIDPNDPTSNPFHLDFLDEKED